MNRKNYFWNILFLTLLLLLISSCNNPNDPNGPIPEQMAYAPGGSFIMGRTIGTGYCNELPTHKVTLGSFYLSKYEVTQAEYAAIMGHNPAHDHGVGDNYPVYYVSWYSALVYCNLRSFAEGFTPVYTIGGSTIPDHWGELPTDYNENWSSAICNWRANGYRLPTEAEWEYAARGGTNTPDYLYSGSDDLDSVAWHYGNHDAQPVGTKAPNALGFYDMSGNICEMCWDRYLDTYYESSPSSNPRGPDSGSLRIIRGGGWVHGEYPEDYRIAARSFFIPQISVYLNVGFRVCRGRL